MTERQANRLFWGLVFIGGGVVLLADNLGYLRLDLSWHKHWPVLLILAGISAMIKAFVRKGDR